MNVCRTGETKLIGALAMVGVYTPVLMVVAMEVGLVLVYRFARRVIGVRMLKDESSACNPLPSFHS